MDEEQMPEELAKQFRPKRTGWIVAVVLGLVVGGAAIYWLRSRPAPEPAAVPAAAPAAVPAPSAPTGPPPPVDPARVRSLLEAVSPSALFRSWVAQGELLRRWVVVTDNVAQGESPRKQLGFLAPRGSFAVVERGQRLLVAPASYQRYDEIADAVASVDAQLLARVYRELHPVLEAAYRALGYPAASLDQATAKALRRILAAPVPPGEVAVVGKGGIYLFADPRLESLGEVEKHLLRMGPRNERLVQAKARDLLQALALDGADGGAPPR